MNEIITIFLGLNILTFFYRKLFNIQNTVLNCGLIGFCGSREPDMARIKILGMYNQIRGKHSCGLWYNETLWKGIKKQAAFEDFILENHIESVEGANVLIGHMRHATYGEHTLENAHPFEINDSLILAHNGTIDNIWHLCNKYGVNHTKIHVDSLALGHLLNKKDVGIKVLNEYKGAAALLLHDFDEPNSLWVYHGASKETANGEEIEERPLFMLRMEEGIYFSSLEYPLFAIRRSEKEIPEMVPHNRVIKVTNGKITKAQFKVDRGNCNVKVPTYHTPQRYIAPSTSSTTPAVESVKLESLHKPLIWSETLPLRALNMGATPNVYFHKGRYWSSDKSELLDGIYNIDKKGYIFEVPDRETTQYAFWKGVFLQSVKLYKNLIIDDKFKAELLDKDRNAARILSKYSRYPVTNLADESTEVTAEFRYCWYRSSEPEKPGFTPMFSDRNYVFKEGYLIRITSNDRTEITLKEEEKPKEEEKKEESPFKDEKDVVEYSDAVIERMLFFDTQWQTFSSAWVAMDEICELAFREYVKDIGTIHEQKELTEDEISFRVKKYIQDSVDNLTSIGEYLENVGKIEEYLKAAEELVEKRKERARNEYVQSYQEAVPNSGELFPVETRQVEPKEYPCIACAGLGTSTAGGTCLICEGSGIKKEPAKVIGIFDDPELNYGHEVEGGSEDNSCALTFEGKDNQHKTSDLEKWDNESAEDLIEDVIIPDLLTVSDAADELQALAHSDLAQDVAFLIYRDLDRLKASLREKFAKHKKDFLTMQLDKKTSKV